MNPKTSFLALALSCFIGSLVFSQINQCRFPRSAYWTVDEDASISFSQDIAVADFDNDGDMDVARIGDIVNDSTLSIYLNCGDGRFERTDTMDVDPEIVQIIAVDIDNDEQIELVGTAFGNVHIFENDGSGSFSQPQDIPVGENTIFIVAADFDGDNDMDIAATHTEGVIVILNEVVDWGAPTNLQVGDLMSGITASDVDGDLDIDLVVTTGDDVGEIITLMNDGKGSFEITNSIPVNLRPAEIVSADFDSDGDNDLAVSNPFNFNTVAIFMNEGTGIFEFDAEYPVGDLPSTLVVGDVDNDSDLDLVTVNFSSDDIDVLLNNQGTFENAGINVPVGGIPVAGELFDLDGDNWLDLIVSSRTGDNFNITFGSSNTLYGRNQIIETEERPREITPADLNNDGFTDFVSTNLDRTLSVFLNDGTGSYGSETEYFVGLAPETSLAGDIDGNGTIDLIALDTSLSQLRTFINNGDGSFVSGPSISMPGVEEIAMGDLDGDGDLDIAGVDTIQDRVSIFRNFGNLNFAFSSAFDVSILGSFIKLIDLDNDQDLDIVVGSTSNFFRIFANNGNGFFVNSGGASLEGSFVSMDTGDIDGDGNLDIVASTDDSIRILFGHGNGSFPFFQPYAADALKVSVVDFDGDGDQDVISLRSTQGGVILHANTGDGTLIEQDSFYFSEYADVEYFDVNNDGFPDAVGGRIDIMISINQCTQLVLGDMNRDGEVNLLDVAPFVAALNSDSCRLEADINGDGTLDLLDVAPFVELVLN